MPLESRECLPQMMFELGLEGPVEVIRKEEKEDHLKWSEELRKVPCRHEGT